MRRVARSVASTAAGDGATTADDVAAARGEAVVLRDHVGRLVRLVASLDVPPLPPDLGCLSTGSGDPVCSHMLRAASGMDVATTDTFQGARAEAARMLAATHVSSDEDSEEGEGDAADRFGEDGFLLDLSWRGEGSGTASRKPRGSSVSSVSTAGATPRRYARVKSNSVAGAGGGSLASSSIAGGPGHLDMDRDAEATFHLPSDVGDGTGYVTRVAGSASWAARTTASHPSPSAVLSAGTWHYRCQASAPHRTRTAATRCHRRWSQTPERRRHSSTVQGAAPSGSGASGLADCL